MPLRILLHSINSMSHSSQSNDSSSYLSTTTLLLVLIVMLSSIGCTTATSTKGTIQSPAAKAETGMSRRRERSDFAHEQVFLPDEFSIDGHPEEEQVVPNRRRALNVNLQCNSPDEVYYNADFNLHTHYSSLSCSQRELDNLRDFLDGHFDKYVAHNEILGPIDMVPTGPSCPSSTRRTKRRLDDSEPGQGTGTNTTEHETMAFEEERELGDDEGESQRELQWGGGGYVWRGGGGCNFCGGDDGDRGRRLTNDSPVTIVIKTDDYPSEASYKIREIDTGVTVYTSPSFSYSNQQYEQTVYLRSGASYKFIVKDTYGDGWCCSNGIGGAKLYAGTSSANTQLINVDYNFGSTERITFVAPTISSAGSAQTAEECTASTITCTGTDCSITSSFSSSSPSFSSSSTSAACTVFTIESAFPQIEHDVSKYLSYYIQQSYHWNSGSCLQGSYPSIWVDLTPTNQGGSMDYC